MASLRGWWKRPASIGCPSVFLQEVGAQFGHFEPLRTVVHLIEQHGKSPYLPGLEPRKLIGVVNPTGAVQAGEVAAVDRVGRVFHPEGDHVIQQGIPVEGGVFFEHRVSV
jgi:hypothetical protein